MKILLLPGFILTSTVLHAQYFYNDITATQETNRQMRSFTDNKVRTVSATGYDENGTRTTDFTEVQEVRENGALLKLSVIRSLVKTVRYSRFDAQGRLTSMTDSSAGAESITRYEYDAGGKITKVMNISKDPENEINREEVHIWTYHSNGRPEKMWRIINRSDSLEVRFVADEKGNPGEEVSYKRGRETDRVYYYFDEESRISDIVRYNDKVKKLLPDNIFSYDDNGRLIQIMSSTPADKYGKITWVSYQSLRYVYDEKGLKMGEVMFNGDQQQTGRIKYSYTFGQ
ncbi:MAG TPA: RHS repeat domain-containing protein [Chitinophagaceae bacterium]|jgi:YD repeat-containing protein|nr:RHS repeat domain-containing protein [Chitinophagaceae bacterium]